MKPKNPTAIAIFAVVILFALLSLAFFASSTILFSIDRSQLAGFGTFIGGVMTPVAIFAALMALILEDRARRTETARLINQGHKADVLRFIEKIEADISSSLDRVNLRLETESGAPDHQCRDVLFKFSLLEWEQIIPISQQLIDRAAHSPLKRDDYQIALFEVFSLVTAQINRLKDYCENYDKLAENNATSLYFARKYRLATQRLSARGYAVDVWSLEVKQLSPP